MFENAVAYTKDGIDYDSKGRHKRDYFDLSVPFEELAEPRNAKEANAEHWRFFKELGAPMDKYKYDVFNESEEEGDNKQ